MTAISTPATPEQIAAAREQYTEFDCATIEIDDNATISDPEDGTGVWVSAWVWVSSPDEDDAAGDES